MLLYNQLSKSGGSHKVEGSFASPKITSINNEVTNYERLPKSWSSPDERCLGVEPDLYRLRHSNYRVAVPTFPQGRWYLRPYLLPRVQSQAQTTLLKYKTKSSALIRGAFCFFISFWPNERPWLYAPWRL